MNGYIKKSDAVDVIVKYPYDIAGKTATAIKMIEGLPDADVVSRAELSILTVQNMALEYAKCKLQHELNKYKGVENILNENMAKLIIGAKEEAKTEVAREIFAEIEKLTNDYRINRKLAERGLSYIVKNGEQNLEQQLAELKKKYTEGEE